MTIEQRHLRGWWHRLTYSTSDRYNRYQERLGTPKALVYFLGVFAYIVLTKPLADYLWEKVGLVAVFLFFIPNLLGLFFLPFLPTLVLDVAAYIIAKRLDNRDGIAREQTDTR